MTQTQDTARLNLLALFGICTISGALSGTIWHFQLAFSDVHTPWFKSMAMDTIYYYGWGLVTLFVNRMTRRYPLPATSKPLLIAVHLPSLLLCSLAAFSLYAGVDIAVAAIGYSGSQPFSILIGFQRRFEGYFLQSAGIFMSVLTYAAIVTLIYARDYRQKLEHEKMRNLELRSKLVQAQLQTLKMQLQPHFFFNTLNSISSLIHVDVNAADRMLTKLGNFLRITLEHAEREHVALEEELRLLKHYLDIEHVRFAERLEVKYDIAEGVMQAAVPNLLLQPFIENAIKHGVSKRIQPGWIKISAYKNNGDLTITVEDSGPEMTIVTPDSQDFSEGIGIKNCRERLQRLYGDRFALALTASPSGGMVVDLHIPFEQQGAAQDA